MMLKSAIALMSPLLLLSPSALALSLLGETENLYGNNQTFIPQNSVNKPEIAQGDPSSISEYAYNFIKEITVKITTPDNRGSGTLIAKKQGNIYLILTNAHVINNSKTVTIQTHDGKTYQATVVNNSLPQDYDLALLEFSSEQEYSVPSDDITAPIKDNPVISGGYVAETGEFVATEGKVTHSLSQSFKEGYSVGYTNNIKQGMSGGPILNGQGALVGINGRSAAPILNTGYIYQNGSTPTVAEIQEYRKVSWGIPINTLLTYIKPDILTAYSLPLPQAVARVETPINEGYIGQLEAKARKFVVRVDSSSTGNGSGVIIAKEGKTYTVLTADHVLCEKDGKNPDAKTPCAERHIYSITTHDGKTIPLDKSTIIRQEGVDLAVFKFESQENYSVAEIADYNPNTNDFVFAAGFPKIGDNDPQWMFSGGRVNEKEQGLVQTRRTKEDLQTQQSGSLQNVSSLNGGYELVYTSITYGGMSGGAVLDSQGRVIGIHGRSEAAVGGKIQIQLGYSLGIPISTFVGLQDRLKAKPQLLTTAKPQVSQQQQQEIIKAIVDIKVPNTNAEAYIWIERGGQLWRLQKYEEAVKAFDEAIKQNKPDNVYLAWYGKGLALGDEGKVQAAIEALEKAILTLPPQSSGDYSAEFHSSILQQQSLTYRYLPDYEKGLTAINKAIALSPNNPNLYNEKQTVLSKLKRYDEALEAINQAIKLTPRAAWYNNQGLLYSDLQKWELAESDYTKAIALNPNDANAYNNRGNLYYDLQKWDLAESDYTKAISLNPNDADAYYNRGNLYSDLQKWDLAESDYTKAIALNPNDANAYNNRGNLY
ncbi:tetratricopeptide repeat-containing serine protease family protein, partial [Crocosphaera sp. XPORK-15E]|uniref:tetratricopeptide repeat-containing serine protease family protein n=1 Tax=Crocosphaera sp. XPORK-15E TaxID=3110247 RepID=UPI002B2157DC